jgi:hypothetical protein
MTAPGTAGTPRQSRTEELRGYLQAAGDLSAIARARLADAALDALRTEVERAGSALGLAGVEEVARLRRTVERLERRVQALEGGAPVRGAGRPSVRPGSRLPGGARAVRRGAPTPEPGLAGAGGQGSEIAGPGVAGPDVAGPGVAGPGVAPGEDVPPPARPADDGPPLGSSGAGGATARRAPVRRPRPDGPLGRDLPGASAAPPAEPGPVAPAPVEPAPVEPGRGGGA